MRIRIMWIGGGEAQRVTEAVLLFGDGETEAA
jgi:hypothetical protein